MTEEDRQPYILYEQEAKRKWCAEKAKYQQEKEAQALLSEHEEVKKQQPKEVVKHKIRKEKKIPTKQKNRPTDSGEQEKQAPVQRHIPHREHASAHDNYRQQVAEDVYSNMSRGPGANVFAGMLWQPDQD
jgi:hypothetical protein